MPSVILQLPSDSERSLREQAAARGRTLEAYLVVLAEQHVSDPGEAPLSDEDFARLLDELSEGPALPHLPADFSRADLYREHD